MLSVTLILTLTLTFPRYGTVLYCIVILLMYFTLLRVTLPYWSVDDDRHESHRRRDPHDPACRERRFIV